MLKKLARLTVILGGFYVLPGCAGNFAGPDYRTWQEEVKLNDGRVIVVTQKRRCQSAYTGGNFTNCIEREAWLIVKLPEFGNQEMVWHEKLKPKILNIHNGRLYIVGFPPTGLKFDLYGKPQPPYIGFMFENGQWKRIPFEAIPEAIYDTNLVQDGSLVKVKFLTLVEKNGPQLNGDPTYPKPIRRIDPTYKSN